MYFSHCGAALRVTTGSSGHAMATLDDIKEDTSVLATRVRIATGHSRMSQPSGGLRSVCLDWRNCSDHTRTRLDGPRRQQQRAGGARGREKR